MTRDDALRRRLLELVERDQELARATYEASQRHPDHRGRFLFDIPRDEWLPEYHASERRSQEHAVVLAQLLDDLGRWPGRSDVGDDGERAAWILAQHVGLVAPELQQRCRDLVADAVRHGDADPEHLAALADRVELEAGRLQLYGTHLEPAPDQPHGWRALRGVVDPPHLDERRAAIGRKPWTEYLADCTNANPRSTMEHTRVTAEQIATLDGLEDWRVQLRALHTTYRTGRGGGSFAGAATLVQRIAELADAADHHPDLDIRYPDVVHIVLTTHDARGLTTRDVDLARQISELARSTGATPEPTASQTLEIAIDTMDADRIRPFWKAVLGYVEDADGNLVDPRSRGPALWFQTMDEPRTDRDRFHLDVTVAHDAAEERVAAALAAGGTLVTDEYARSWWVLADADGNEACVSTWQDRDRFA